MSLSRAAVGEPHRALAGLTGTFHGSTSHGDDKVGVGNETKTYKKLE